MSEVVTFVPRDEYEVEAVEIDGLPKFNIGQRVRATFYGDKGPHVVEGVVSEIYLRTVNWPYWQFRIEGLPGWRDDTDLEAI